MTNTVLVTGGAGFVGSALISRLAAVGYKVHALTRNRASVFPAGVESHQSDILATDVDADFLQGINCVVHCAARVHIMNDETSNPLDEYRKLNVEGTLRLARQAAKQGVKRFIFISSIKVNGESTPDNKPFNVDSAPNPSDPYGVSKLEAEIGLKELASATGMELVIIRPSLIYGPGVKANFRNMMKWIYKGVPLPLGAIKNQRSFVAIDNLVDLIITCIRSDAAANQLFLASDGRDLSTTELIRLMAAALGKRAFLLPIPMSSINFLAALCGRASVSQRLCGSLRVDVSHAQKTLGWTPVISVEDALKITAVAFLKDVEQ